MIPIGKKLPAFSLPRSDGSTWKTSDALSSDGKGGKLVLFFYPKAMTPGCTLEGQDFRDLHDEFLKAKVPVFGISRDSVASHERFKKKMSFPFELLSDPEEKACTIFDMMKMKKLYGREYRGVDRSTFVIDRKGRIARAWRGVKVPGHAQEVLDFVRTAEL